MLGDAKGVPWMDLLTEALTQPGLLSQAYRMFHRYSTGNQILAMLQLGERAGPLATYRKWTEMGRQVRKGEKAIALYVPVTLGARRKGEAEETEGERPPEGKGSKGGRKVFLLRRYWFSLAQTEGPDGEPFEVPEPPGWSSEQAFARLGIKTEPFSHPDGNTMGYCYVDRKVMAVSPLSPHPFKTQVHEMAHALMHAEANMGISSHGSIPPRDVAEVEAETVAYIVCSTLGFDTHALASSRGYIQSWMEDPQERAEFAQKRASRVFSTANRIIQAGQLAVATDEDSAEIQEAA